MLVARAFPACSGLTSEVMTGRGCSMRPSEGLDGCHELFLDGVLSSSRSDAASTPYAIVNSSAYRRALR